MQIYPGTQENLSIQDVISLVGIENTGEYRSWCKYCQQCNSWIAVSDACRTCLSAARQRRQYFHKMASPVCTSVAESPKPEMRFFLPQLPPPATPKNTTSTNSAIYPHLGLSESCSSDLQLDKIFPNASEDMKILL